MSMNGPGLPAWTKTADAIPHSTRQLSPSEHTVEISPPFVSQISRGDGISLPEGTNRTQLGTSALDSCFPDTMTSQMASEEVRLGNLASPTGEMDDSGAFDFTSFNPPWLLDDTFDLGMFNTAISSTLPPNLFDAQQPIIADESVPYCSLSGNVSLKLSREALVAKHWPSFLTDQDTGIITPESSSGSSCVDETYRRHLGTKLYTHISSMVLPSTDFLVFEIFPR